MDYSKFKGGGKYVYLPLKGDEATFEIVKMSFGRSDIAKFNFNTKEDVKLPDGTMAAKTTPILNPETKLPFNLQCELKEGKILSVSGWCAFMSIFKKGDVQDGDIIKVGHPGQGEWTVEKIGTCEPEINIPF